MNLLICELLYSEHNIYKRRLDLDGKPIADPVKHEVGEIEEKNNETTTELEVPVVFNSTLRGFVSFSYYFMLKWIV